MENPPVHPSTDWYVTGTALANIALIQYANLRLSDKDADVLTAEGEALDDKRKGLGLPEVPASPAAGKLVVGVTGGPITIPDATEYLYPNGLRGKLAGIHVGVSDGDEVEVIAIDTGELTNLAAGETVQWVNPPLNLQVEATVSVSNPLTGGTNEESDARKRARILNRLANVPQGGNPGHMIEIALDALASVQYAFVYPALGGPASAKVTLVKDIDPAKSDYSRVMPAGGIELVRAALHNELPDGMEVVVGPADEVGADVGLQVTIPESLAVGGDGTGWLDETVWPNLIGADNGRVTVTAVTHAAEFVVSANTTVPPISNQTHITWWSELDQIFHTRLVYFFTGGVGSRRLFVDEPLVNSDGTPIAVGDFISPAAVNIAAYGATWRETMRNLGPGENTSDVNRLPRSLRFPAITDEWNSALGYKQLELLTAKHSEITNVAYSYPAVLPSPAVPATVDLNPEILVPGKFGIYKI
jgi:uncharacterized phage protein gp47/JayE